MNVTNLSKVFENMVSGDARYKQIYLSGADIILIGDALDMFARSSEFRTNLSDRGREVCNELLYRTFSSESETALSENEVAIIKQALTLAQSNSESNWLTPRVRTDKINMARDLFLRLNSI